MKNRINIAIFVHVMRSMQMFVLYHLKDISKAVSAMCYHPKYAAQFTVSDKISVDGMIDIKQNAVSKPTQTWRKYFLSELARFQITECKNIENGQRGLKFKVG